MGPGGAAWGSGEIAVGQAEGVEGRVARVVPEQLLLQQGDGRQGQDQGLVLEHAVHVQAWGGGVEAQSGRVPPAPNRNTRVWCRVPSPVAWVQTLAQSLTPSETLGKRLPLAVNFQPRAS